MPSAAGWITACCREIVRSAVAGGGSVTLETDATLVHKWAPFEASGPKAAVLGQRRGGVGVLGVNMTSRAV